MHICIVRLLLCNGTGGGEKVHLKGENSVAMSGLGCEKPLVGAGGAITLVLSPRKQTCYLVWPHIPASKASFQLEWAKLEPRMYSGWMSAILCAV